VVDEGRRMDRGITLHEYKGRLGAVCGVGHSPIGEALKAASLNFSISLLK
jgi:hypothetical protein